MDFSFTGKTVLVTGAGSGIGATTALLYAEQGAKVIIADTSEEEGNDTVSRIKSQNGEASFLRMRVSSLAACSLFIKKAAGVHGRIDIACNNASRSDESPYGTDKNPEAFDHEADFPLDSLYCCMKYEIETMQKQDKGIIVNITSLRGALGMLAFSPYVNLKYGIIELMPHPAVDYIPGSILIHAITPAYLNASLWENTKAAGEPLPAKLSPIDRLGKIEAIARLAIWLSQ